MKKKKKPFIYTYDVQVLWSATGDVKTRHRSCPLGARSLVTETTQWRKKCGGAQLKGHISQLVLR